MAAAAAPLAHVNIFRPQKKKKKVKPVDAADDGAAEGELPPLKMAGK